VQEKITINSDKDTISEALGISKDKADELLTKVAAPHKKLSEILADVWNEAEDFKIALLAIYFLGFDVGYDAALERMMMSSPEPQVDEP
jgi:hypothetical protein